MFLETAHTLVQQLTTKKEKRAIMGNSPSEANGARCSECGCFLSPCKSSSGYVSQEIKGKRYYVFNRGEYYRQYPADRFIYVCRTCFFKPDHNDELRQQQQEEERRRQETQRRQQQEREERRRLADEARNKQEQQDAQEELQRWVQNTNEDLFEGEVERHLQKQRQVLVDKYTPSDASEAVKVLPISPSCLSLIDFVKAVESLPDYLTASQTSRLARCLEVLRRNLFDHWCLPAEVSYFKALESFLLVLYCRRHLVDKHSTEQKESALLSLHGILVQIWDSMKLVGEHHQFCRVLYLTACAGEETPESSMRYLLNAALSRFGMSHTTDKTSSIDNFRMKMLRALLQNAAIVSDQPELSSNWQSCCVSLFVQASCQEDQCLFEMCRDYPGYTDTLLALVKGGVWSYTDIAVLLPWIGQSFKNHGVQSVGLVLHVLLTFGVRRDKLCPDAQRFRAYLSENTAALVGAKAVECAVAAENRTLFDIVLATGTQLNVEQQMKVLYIVADAKKLNQISDGQLSEGKGSSDLRNASSFAASTSDNPFGFPTDSEKSLPLMGETLAAILSELCQGVNQVFHYFPRDTQMVSWVILALLNQGCIQEIGTGEGKSCIIAMFAAYLCRKGRCVDVVTSSPVLAKRDACEWRPFYKQFGIRVDYNIDKQSDSDRLHCYESRVVYGTVET